MTLDVSHTRHPAHDGSGEPSAVTGGGYSDLLDVLSEGSVRRHFDPYLDIPWDDPEFAFDEHDPRWVLTERDPLGAQPWYRQQSLERRIAIGRWKQMNTVRVGLEFESVLIRGMMQYVIALPNGKQEFRYCLHEMTEECNHIQMFQELVNRSGVDVPGMRPFYKKTTWSWGVLGAAFPIIFFIGVLAGEEPIDHVQKDVIRDGDSMIPAVRRAMEIHIAEEARHISFAHAYLEKRVPKLARWRRAQIALWYPAVMRWLAGAIMVPPKQFQREFDIPDQVWRDAFWRSPASKEILAGYFGDVRMLADRLGIRDSRAAKAWWRALGVAGRPSRFRGEPRRLDTTRSAR